MVQDGSQLTMVWHVDNLKIFHKKKEVVDSLIEWLRTMYEDKEIGEIKRSRGTKHDYLGMELDFGTKGEVQIKMMQYVEDMVKSFPYPEKVWKEVVSPAAEHLYKID